MGTDNKISRRTVLKGSLIGFAAMSIPLLSDSRAFSKGFSTNVNKPHINYPSLNDEEVSAVVGASHFDLEKVKKLVENRPELARATWDWGFGDFESAIGAASHVGRRDIVSYLFSKGARPNIFSYTVLGAHEAVKSMIEFTPGIQTTLGPHGISLLSHAKASLRMKETMTQQNIESAEKLIAYLEALGDADGKTYEDIEESEKAQYLGDYKYGDGEEEGFSIKLNMRNFITLGRIGAFGGALYKIGDNRYFYNGARSTEVTFQLESGNVKSLTVNEPNTVLVATKV